MSAYSAGRCLTPAAAGDAQEVADTILVERFIVGTGGAVGILNHNQPPGFILDLVVLKCQHEPVFWRLAVEPFYSCPFLNHLPGQLKTKLKPLDGGISGKIGHRSAEAFAETCNGYGEAAESCGHRRIPWRRISCWNPSLTVCR